MSEKTNQSVPLRLEAEAQLARSSNTDDSQRSAEEILHELRIHQIELEMQNESLRQAQIEMEQSRDRYVDLYDFAPIGYLTLAREGTISDINLTGAVLLAMERKQLKMRRFSRFVAAEDRDRWERFLANVLQQDERQSCELSLRREDDSKFMARLDCLHMLADSKSSVRIALTDITRDSEMEAEIHRLAYYDPLTQLPNRRLLMDRLGQALAASRRSGRYGALLFLDLDNFKTLNDTRGHAIGDLLLVELTQRLNANVREGDTVGRLGGDEFVLMLEDLSENIKEATVQASMIGLKVREAVALPYLLDGIEFSCTASIGISLFFNHNESADDLLKHADIAMYQAKKGGRNSVRFFDPDMQAALVEHTALENDLRRALERHELHLYYQIQVNSAYRTIGAEALLRWEHPERGLVYPAQFIPLAEETGLILPIGLWVLQTVCAQIGDWSANPDFCELQIAINVSARQFRQPDFARQVQQAIAASGIDPARLKIELTENLMLDDIGDTLSRMQELEAQSISFSMDDFGTGHFSLSCLKQLPLEQLKIDLSFVRDMTTDPDNAAIVQAIITMGHAFGLKVIAEGVETEEQYKFLDIHGCHAFQGYLFGKPVPVAQFEEQVLQYA